MPLVNNASSKPRSPQCENLLGDRERGARCERQFALMVEQSGLTPVRRGQTETPDFTILPINEHHEVKDKNPTVGGMFGLEAYRWDGMKKFRRQNAQEPIYYTIHNWASSPEGREWQTNRIEDWITCSIDDLLRAERDYKTHEQVGMPWMDGRPVKTRVVYWPASLWKPLSPVREAWLEFSMTPYQRFVSRWGDCRKCILCRSRSRIVLARGRVPADVLLVGEAPGESENVIGSPFTGPAGHLLDQIVKHALRGRPALSCCFTNLICCIPRLPPPAVVNVKREPCDALIDRTTEWGNPYRVGRDGTRAEVIAKYRERLRQQTGLIRRLEALAGKRLGCHCKPLPCHGDEIVLLFRELWGDKAEEPPRWAIEACRPRLDEFIALCRPKLIVRVGKQAIVHCKPPPGALTIGITHPAAILRMEGSQQQLAAHRCSAMLKDAADSL